ncbi:hypothetical protein [Geopsychrobacter electrodiphilus]|uniref:hypothetical protein n=1 Tax=Geopsychrobacter electrodiphilus TaxID=225196 RepID=UPI00036BE2F9|nr:hypothetical protein [Geopsychrobacter electrodiphilus]
MAEILSSLGWPHFTFIFAIVFLLIFRTQISGFISRISSIDKGGVKTSPVPEAQREKEKTEAVQELLLAIGDSIVMREVEGRIVADLQSKELETESGTAKVLIKHLAASKILLEFEQIHNLIFGSQIYLLKKLNEVTGQGQDAEVVKAQFDHVKSMFNKEFEAWDFDKYMYFLTARSLVTIENNQYHITNLGVEYLTWIARNGRSENRPL